MGGLRQGARGDLRLARLARSARCDVVQRVRRAPAPGTRRPRGRVSSRRRARHGRLEPGTGAVQPRVRLGRRTGRHRRRIRRRPRAPHPRLDPSGRRSAGSARGHQEQRTLFIVSSKSGSTTEPNAYQAAMSEIAPALDFIAITDPGHVPRRAGPGPGVPSHRRGATGRRRTVLRADRLRARARDAQRRRSRRVVGTGTGHGRCVPSASTRRPTRGSASGPRSVRRPSPGATSSRS